MRKLAISSASHPGVHRLRLGVAAAARRCPRAWAALLWLLVLAVAIPLRGAGQEIDPGGELRREIATADALLEVGETQAAESHLRQATLEGWLLLGSLHTARGAWEEAKEAFEVAGMAAVEMHRAHSSLAMLHLKLGETTEAIALMRALVAREPDSGNTRRLLAQALVVNGQLGEAVQELEELHHGQPEDLETTYALASGYLKKGDAERSEELFGEILEARPIAASHVLIGRTYRDFREFDRARRELRRAMEIDPEARRAHYYLGTVEVIDRGLDALSEAIGLFEEELALYPEDPITNLYLAKALSEERRFEEAIPLLEIAEQWPPGRLDALRILGRCRLGLGETEAGIESLREALEVSQDQGARPRQLSGIHYQLGQALRRLGRREEAQAEFATAQELSKDLVDEEREGMSSFVAGEEEFDVSRGLPIEVTRLGRVPEDERARFEAEVRALLVGAYLNLGTLHSRAGRFENAYHLFEAASRVDPDAPRIAFSLGAAAFNAGRFEVAVQALSKARLEQPDDADLARMLALAYLNLEDYGPAAELLRADPRRASQPSLQYAFGMALVRSGQREEGRAVFDRLILENPEWPELHVMLGQAYADEEDFEAAIAEFERALEIRADVPEASSSLGFLFLRQGRLEEAETALRRELSHRPRDVRARYQLAVVLDLARRSDEARAELEIVLRAQPEFADARYLLGKIRLAQGAPEEAVAHLEAAMSLAPGDYNIRYQLAQAYQRMGRREEAQEQFQAYRELKGKPGGRS